MSGLAGERGWRGPACLPGAGLPPPPPFSKTGLGRQSASAPRGSSSTCRRGQAFVLCAGLVIGWPWLVVTRISWEGSEETSSLGAGQEGWGQEGGKAEEGPSQLGVCPGRRKHTPLPISPP